MIIGICGRAGSGKSSVGQHLVETLGAERISFAEPMKRLAIDLWGFSEQQVFGDATAKETIDPRWGISPREALQRLGHGARVHLDEYVWIKAALYRAGRPGLFVIDDLRYRNEADAISAVGYVLRLHCTDSISTDAGTHPSEAEVDLIPPEHVFAELYSSRAQGLSHLFGLVDDAVAKMRR